MHKKLSKFIVIGDLILDTFIEYNNLRLSPESPIISGSETNRKNYLGGSANLALNLFSLTKNVELFAAIGKDKEGLLIKNLLLEHRMPNVIFEDAKQTTTKIRLTDTNGKHIFRIDRESKYIGIFQRDIIKYLKINNIVIISDYDKGIINKTFVKKIINKSKKTYVDPKQSPSLFKNAYLIKPNMGWVIKWFKKFSVEDFFKIKKKYGWQNAIITDSGNGVHVFIGDKYTYLETKHDKVIDVSGAGDSFLASIVYHHEERKFSILESTKITLKSITKIISNRGITTLKKLPKFQNNNVVWANGVFDVLHLGHVRLLKYARTLGSKLIVGINSDYSTRLNKGSKRPINDENTRKLMIEELGLADEVLIFNEKTPLKILNKIRPDIIIKGSDYKSSDVIANKNAKVILYKYQKGFSSSLIINKI